MIRLTSYTSGKAISVSPELVKVVIEDANFTYVHFGPDEDCIKVSETREEVARKVLEWRLAMEDFKACLMIHDASTSGAVNKLHNLAGLEEQGHE